MENIHNITENVERLLRTGETMRNKTDKELIFAYWQKYDGLKSTINKKIVKTITNPVSIVRVKRSLVAENPAYGPTQPELIRRKRQIERKMRRHFSPTS